MCAFKEKKLKCGTADTAFITRGYQNWKDATIAFRNHESSACHKDAVAVMITIPATHGDIGECLSSQLALEKQVNRECFMKLISSIRFLARQGLSQILQTNFSDAPKPVRLSSIQQFLTGLSQSQPLLSEVVKLMKIILVMPATNATSERSFSALKRVKTYLRSTMKQSRLNHLMILHVHKEMSDSLNLVDCANDFVGSNEHRLRVFGKFT